MFESLTNTTDTSDPNITEDVSVTANKLFFLGYRKVFICALSITVVTIMSFFDVPHIEKAMETVMWIAGGYCGINLFKSGISKTNVE